MENIDTLAESNNVCCICGNVIRNIYYEELDSFGNLTGRISCAKYSCRAKATAGCRNKDLDPNSNSGKGYVSEALVAKFLGIKTCFDITGNFNYPGHDLLEHEDWGLINVKSSSLILKRSDNIPSFYHIFNVSRNSRCDFFFLIGYDEEREHVIAVYIIPNEDYVSKLTGSRIPFNVRSKWNIFKESEEEVKKWDELFHTMKLDNCPILRKKSVNKK